MKWLPQNFNDFLAFLYFPFVLVWVVILALIWKYLDVSIIESLGLGTATGIILSKFGDIYQFYFRKTPDIPATSEIKTTSSTTTTNNMPMEEKK